MSNETIQADYEALNAIANRFAKNGERVESVRKSLLSRMERLTASWKGRGSDAFFGEMHDEVLPAVARLGGALGAASHTVNEIIELIQAAEADSSAPFKSRDDVAKSTPPGAGGGAGDSGGTMSPPFNPIGSAGGAGGGGTMSPPFNPIGSAGGAGGGTMTPPFNPGGSGGGAGDGGGTMTPPFNPGGGSGSGGLGSASGAGGTTMPIPPDATTEPWRQGDDWARSGGALPRDWLSSSAARGGMMDPFDPYSDPGAAVGAQTTPFSSSGASGGASDGGGSGLGAASDMAALDPSIDSAATDPALTSAATEPAPFASPSADLAGSGGASGGGSGGAPGGGLSGGGALGAGSFGTPSFGVGESGAVVAPSGSLEPIPFAAVAMQEAGGGGGLGHSGSSSQASHGLLAGSGAGGAVGGAPALRGSLLPMALAAATPLLAALGKAFKGRAAE